MMEKYTTRFGVKLDVSLLKEELNMLFSHVGNEAVERLTSAIQAGAIYGTKPSLVLGDDNRYCGCALAWISGRKSGDYLYRPDYDDLVELLNVHVPFGFKRGESTLRPLERLVVGVEPSETAETNQDLAFLLSLINEWKVENKEA